MKTIIKTGPSNVNAAWQDIHKESPKKSTGNGDEAANGMGTLKLSKLLLGLMLISLWPDSIICIDSQWPVLRGSYLGQEINTKQLERDCCVDPDERYILFNTIRLSGQ